MVSLAAAWVLVVLLQTCARCTIVRGQPTLGVREAALQTRVLQQQQQQEQLPANDDAGAAGPRRQTRCGGTRGAWCKAALRHQRQLQPRLEPPRGNRACPSHPTYGMCSSVGNCNFDLGVCDCPAGWQGPDCSQPLLRPCTTSFRRSYTDPPVGHIDEEGRDLNHASKDFTESRCLGICDPVLGRCFCDGKFRRHNPRNDSRPGTPPKAIGRPLCNHWCQPKDDDKGNVFPWGAHPWSDLYGPQGWCNSNTPTVHLDCRYDGQGGRLCEDPIEMTCINQCSGHGECDQGFCKCHEGWYGSDCARKRAGLPMEPPLSHPSHPAHRPWLTNTVAVHPPAPGDQGGAAAPPQPRGRKRPYIYVYDLPPAYTTRMMQYRVEKGMCTWRLYSDGNRTQVGTYTVYAVELLMHELFLQSEHRTFDPEEADFFYVPIHATCFIFPIHSWADGPWWYAPGGPRVMHVTHMMLEALGWIRVHMGKYWDRRKGSDHIWLMAHDEGACYAPSEISKTSIMLTHWGRMDLNHRSNTAFTPDNYTQEHVDVDPTGWTHLYAGRPCYDPAKDLVIPAFKTGDSFPDSPLVSKAPSKRDITFFFRGDVGETRLPWYSRGIRQKLYNLSRGGWAKQHGIHVGHYSDLPGSYSQLLARSRYCLVAPGDGFSARAEDAVLHGCIPVVIMDNVHAVYESILDWGSFSLRVAESEIDKLPEILAAVSPQRERQMRRNLRRVWHRFVYTSHPLLKQPIDQVVASNKEQRRAMQQAQQPQQRRRKVLTQQDQEQGQAGTRRRRRRRTADSMQQDGAGSGDAQGWPFHRDDAFHTIIQWLMWRALQRDGQATET